MKNAPYLITCLLAICFVKPHQQRLIAHPMQPKVIVERLTQTLPFKQPLFPMTDKFVERYAFDFQ